MEYYLQHGGTKGLYFLVTIENNLETFLLLQTQWVRPSLVPEINLRLSHDALSVWARVEEYLGIVGLPPPFWAFAWAGGQALARFILDNPSYVQNKSGIDLASGSGLVAIAAALAGAEKISATDIDRLAAFSIAINAKENGVSIDIQTRDLLASAPPRLDFLLIGDLFYEKSLATRVLSWARMAADLGAVVLVGDPQRSYFPAKEFLFLKSYLVEVSEELEDSRIKLSSVWRLK